MNILKSIRFCFLLTLCPVGIFFSMPSLAHHSFSMFDSDTVTSVQGTIYRVQWSNPHSWVWVSEPSEDGGEDTIWALEGGSPTTFSRFGFTKNDFEIGTAVTVDFHPLRNGQKGGQFLRITYEDGRIVGDLRTPVDVLKDAGYGNKEEQD